MQKLELGHDAETRAVLGFAATFLSNEPPVWLEELLFDSDPQKIATAAQSHQIHTMIAPLLRKHSNLTDALPRDLCIFFEAMYEANQERLAGGVAQLAEIGTELSTLGIPAIALKGGGDMLHPLHTDQAIRFVGDLDILIPATRAHEAQDCLLKIGAETHVPLLEKNEDFNWRGHPAPKHHLPKITRPDWHFPVELHMTVGKSEENTILPIEEAWDRAVPTITDGILRFNDQDNACNLVAHAIRHNGAVSVRAWIDWAALRIRCDKDNVVSRFKAAGMKDAYVEFDLITTFLEQGLPDGKKSPAAHEIAREALVNFGQSPTRDIQAFGAFLQRKIRALAVSPDYRRYVAKNVMSLKWWTGVIRKIFYR